MQGSVNDLYHVVHNSPSVQFSSVAQSCPSLCNLKDCSTPGLPVHHQRPELAQTHIHGAGDALQPSHPLSSPSPPAFTLSKHQGLSQRLSSSHQVAKGPEYPLTLIYNWTFASLDDHPAVTPSPSSVASVPANLIFSLFFSPKLLFAFEV